MNATLNAKARSSHATRARVVEIKHALARRLASLSDSDLAARYAAACEGNSLLTLQGYKIEIRRRCAAEGAPYTLASFPVRNVVRLEWIGFERVDFALESPRYRVSV